MNPSPILYLTAGLVHPSPYAVQRLRGALCSVVGEAVTSRRGLNLLTDLSPEEWPVCVLYFHKKADSPEVVNGLVRYVEDGGRLLTVHGVSASFKGNERFLGLLGGVFSGHEPICPLEVTWKPPHGYGVSPDVPARTFSLVDEPYEHRFSGDVEEVARWELSPASGASETAGRRAGGVREGRCAWVRIVGAGRVAYLSAGHRAAVWAHPGVRELLGALLKWLSVGGET